MKATGQWMLNFNSSNTRSVVSLVVLPAMIKPTNTSVSIESIILREIHLPNGFSCFKNNVVFPAVSITALYHCPVTWLSSPGEFAFGFKQIWNADVINLKNLKVQRHKIPKNQNKKTRIFRPKLQRFNDHF